jgi:hypothetical protein
MRAGDHCGICGGGIMGARGLTMGTCIDPNIRSAWSSKGRRTGATDKRIGTGKVCIVGVLAKDAQFRHAGGMAIKNLLDDFQNALSIAQAGIKGTMKSLKQAQSQAKKRTVRKRTPKKKVPAGGRTKPTVKRKQKQRVRNPSNLVIKARAAVSRKPSKQTPARKSKSKYWP